MKNYFILVCIFFTLTVYSQTESLEIENLARRYAAGEFSQTELAQLGRDWAALLKSIGSYPKLPYNEKTKEIEFNVIKTFSNIDKKTIYDRTMEWGALVYGSLSAVLHYSNLENGKIIMKGWFKVFYKSDFETIFAGKKEKVSNVTCNFTQVSTIKDNKLKIEVVDIIYEYNFQSNLIGSTYIPSSTIETPIKYFYPITNNASVEWKGNLDLINQTNIRITSLFDNLEYYINNKSRDYDF